MRILVFSLLLCLCSLGAERKQLFNGKNLDGWRMTGPGEFKVEDGLLATYGGMGLLYYEREPLANVKLRVVFQTTGGRDNSGVIIRMPEKPSDPWYGVHNGYEVQIDAGGDEWHRTGAIYSLSKAAGDWQQKPAGEWNVMEIELRGPDTIVSLNGKVVNRFREGQEVPPRKMWYEPVRGPRPNSGYIGLQNHDAKSKVLFREISVEPLGR
jgi:hypothetical protein